MELQPTIALNLWTADGVTVDPVPSHTHVTVNLGADLRIYGTDPEVFDQLAHEFANAADELRAKQVTA